MNDDSKEVKDLCKKLDFSKILKRQIKVKDRSAKGQFLTFPLVSGKALYSRTIVGVSYNKRKKCWEYKAHRIK